MVINSLSKLISHKELSQVFDSKILLYPALFIVMSYTATTQMEKLVDTLADNGILTLSKKNKLRLVTHFGISIDDIDFSIEQIITVMKQFFR